MRTIVIEGKTFTSDDNITGPCEQCREKPAEFCDEFGTKLDESCLRDNVAEGLYDNP